MKQMPKKNQPSTKVLSLSVPFLLTITLIFNGLAASGALNGITTGEISDLYPVLFTPAGYVFSIWSVIYVALAGFSIYQLLPKQQTSRSLNKLRILFNITCVLNSIWILAWQYQFLIVSLCVMIGLLLTLIKIDQEKPNLKLTSSKLKWWCIDFPFSLYLGWVSVATIANVSVVLYDLNWNQWGLSDVFWTVVMIGAATLLASTKIIRQKDLVFAGVVIWAIIGIAVKNQDISSIGTTVKIGVGWLTAVIAYSLLKKQQE